MASLVGQTVSHYRILAQIGVGGMGVVYRAEDTHLKRTVALKFLPRELTRDPDARERFVHEALAASALQHFNICTIYDIDQTDDDTLFMVMELYDGETLKERLTRGPLTLSDALAIALPVGQGLAKAHDRGIVHRDFKPANVVITSDGVPKIVDFGIAKLVGQSRLTKAGSTVGTAAYMSPEQARGGDVDHRTDIWSFGVVLYEMVTGQLPFRGAYDQGLIYSIMHDEPPSLATVGPHLPPQLDAIIRKSLAKDPAARFLRITEMLTLLSALAPGTAPAVPVVRARHGKGLRWAIPALAVVIAAGAYFLAKIGGALDVGPGPIDRPVHSIAVLPFADYSKEKDQDYFCYGIAEELTTRLSRIPDLRVVARTSSLAKRGADSRDIGKELGVATVLEGSLRKEGNRFLITSRLVNLADGTLLWSDTYDREMEGIFSIQLDVASSVANALRITLAEPLAERLIISQTKDVKAYEYWLRGSYLVKLFLTSRRMQDIDDAILMCKKALAIDSLYALAHGGLAWAYEHRYVYGEKKNPADRMEVLHHTRRAYELDSTSGSINAGMGYVAFKTGDQDAAYRFFKKAISLEPRSMWVNHLAGLFLAGLGLVDRAQRFYVQAIELDPYYLFAIGEVAVCCEYAGDREKAATYYRRAYELSPKDRVYKPDYIRFMIASGQIQDAERLLRDADALDPGSEIYRECKALLLASQGNQKDALRLGGGPEVFALLNMREEAIRALVECAGKSNPHQYLSLLNNPLYHNLRADSRFEAILKEQRLIYEERIQKYGDL